MQSLVCLWIHWCHALGRRPTLGHWRRCSCGLLPGDAALPGQSCHSLPALRRVEAVALLKLRLHRSRVDVSITADLNWWAEQIAWEAQSAAKANDSASLHGLARRLRSGHDRPHAALRAKDGSILTDPDGIAERWTEHWTDHFAGSQVFFAELRRQNDSLQVPADFPRADPVSLPYVLGLLQASPGSKATGPDGIGPSTWKAGGAPAASVAQKLLNTVRAHARAPLEVKGGRMQDV